MTSTVRSTAPAIRVGVIDDHEMFRAGVISTIKNEFKVVGQAGDVESAIAMIGRDKPDVVLLDVHVPGGQGGGGSEIIVRSVAVSPRTLYLALSVSDSAVDVGAVIRAGARGYVTKTITAEDLIASVRQVADGYAVFSPKLAGFVLTAFNRDAEAPSHVASVPGNVPSAGDGRNAAEYSADYSADDIDVLSPREQEVMRLIARGYSYKEVAAELFISVKTVETHVSAVLRKLQLSNRGELARWAAHRRIV
ncbi:MAG: response regulator transcription factor [Bifidobacteriaceae bacterium]|jgi:DNA-binding NarL/FixJ family response regulator|nr:response regulator transcription factor [Bifidobacteriaceae bacterium]MCI1915470.1 response regulator transcription factor [Bifidobacteriaceae bacterium]